MLYCTSPEVNFLPLCLNAVRRTLLCFSSSLKLLAIRACKSDASSEAFLHESVYPWSLLRGSKDNYFDLITRLGRLFFRIKKMSICYLVRLKSLGPMVVVAGHLMVPSTVDILTPNKYLTSIAADSCLHLCLIFSYYSMSLQSLFHDYKVNLDNLPNASRSCCECSFYAFRFGHIASQSTHEISLIEMVSRGSYLSFGCLLISFLRLFYGFQDISKVVL